VQVHTASLKSLVQGEKQFQVPIWQRQYTWRTTQHAQLWSDLAEQYRHLKSGNPPSSGHFLGSFVLSPKDPAAAGVSYFLVIDGQQRLTTLMLLLCALRDRAAETDPRALERYDEVYLVNKFHQGVARMRLLPTEEDRASFRRWLTREPDNGAGDDISRAYRFYAACLSEPLDDEQIDIDLLTRAAVERLEIVEISTQHGDNAHRIFQSLNGTGVPLNQADLLRNYLFMLLPTRADDVYGTTWRPMEELISVENLQGLARVDLQRRGWDVPRDQVYARHQQRIDPISHDEDEVEAQVRDLARQATLYKRLIDPRSESDPPTREGLQRLARWGAQTAYPTLMVALDLHAKDIVSVEDLRRAVLLIESFFIRRQLARIPTNALNRVFVQIIDKLPRDETFVDALHRELSRDRLYWPTDDGIRQAVQAQPFYHIGRWHQRKLILERIERSFGHPEVIDFQEAELQIEHIMPQTLTPEWRAMFAELAQEPDQVHGQLVHTLGNLTLTAFNGTLSNNPFERKQEIYGASHLEMNTSLVQTDVWGRDEILNRAATLAEKIIGIWPPPLAGVTPEEEEGFDWSRVAAAIEAIPPGRWTTYGELAELAGTSAQAVGGYVANVHGDTNAYRVLSSDGAISAGFRWNDPHDARDVRAVLEAEGVVFDADRASLDQRLGAEELAALIETPEDQVGEDISLGAEGVGAAAPVEQ
jgi:alkylated DNA nucleotide flippase Atl1